MKKETDINNALDILGLKPASKRVLITLSEYETSNVADLASSLNMPKSSVYDALGELIDRSLVTEYSDDRGKTFGISDKEQIVRIHKQKMEQLEAAQTDLISFIQSNHKENQVARPRIKFYSGVEGIKQAFRDMPWNKKYPEAYLMWPTTDMINLLGEEFLYNHRKPGLDLGIGVNVIERAKDRSLEKSNYDWLKNGGQNKLNRKRYLSGMDDWKMSYWIYGDKCLFASGGSEKVAFIVHSKEFADLQKIMWQQVWDGCEE